MKKTYFTVGPSQIYRTVEDHTKQALQNDIFSLNHRSKEFQDLYQSVDSGLKKLLQIPESHSIYFLSSGTEAMERVIQNGVERVSGHIVSGSFGKRFFETARELGKDPVQLTFHEKSSQISTMEFSKDTELIAITQNDTSTGYHIPMEHVYQLAKKYPQKLIALDTVSSIPYIDIDYKKVDYVFFSIQKGFGLPAGLGVLVVSPRAIQKAKQLHSCGISIGSYHSIMQLQEFYEKFQTPETPNVFGIYVLNSIVTDYLKSGITTVRTMTDKKAHTMYTFFDTHPAFRPVIEDPVYRSKTTIVVEAIDGSSKLVHALEQRGFIVGSGYGERKGQDIRIANFPAHTLKDVKKLLSVIKEIS